jgi:hypothetical protein
VVQGVIRTVESRVDWFTTTVAYDFSFCGDLLRLQLDDRASNLTISSRIRHPIQGLQIVLQSDVEFLR